MIKSIGRAGNPTPINISNKNLPIKLSIAIT